MDEIDEQKVVTEYLDQIGGMYLEESDLAYKFSVMSQEDYDTVVGYFFLLGYNVGKPRESTAIPGWMIGRIYKDGEPIDEEEDEKF